MANLPHILVSNDDGVNAPGIIAMVSALAACDWCRVSVCGPAEEQSAKSHSITLSKVMVATAIPKVHPALIDSYAVSGSPADSVLLAMASKLLQTPKLDLVVSGINRGENCGLHILYSGTVGAAREAAVHGVRSIAISLHDYFAYTPAQFSLAAESTLPLIKAMLGLLEVPAAPVGYILNVNVPPTAAAPFSGYAWAKQGMSSAMSKFEERTDSASNGALSPTSTSHKKEYDELLQDVPGVREFVRGTWFYQGQGEVNGDLTALASNWVSVTPLKLMQDVQPNTLPADVQAYWAFYQIVKAAAASTGTKLQGIP